MVTRGTIQQPWMILLMLGRWWITHNCEIPVSPDILWVLLTRLASLALSTASESMVLGLPDTVWSLMFLWPEQIHLNHVVNNCIFTFCTANDFGCFRDIMVQFKLAEFNYIAHSCIWLSNHILSEVMYNMSVHQLPQYYQPQHVSSIAWTALVMWCTCHKLACTKILQNYYPEP